MPRERRNQKFKGKIGVFQCKGDLENGNQDLKPGIHQPESPSTKKRKSANSNNPSQASPSLPDLVPPPPLTGYGETIVASNPFDDTPGPMSHQHTMVQNVPQQVPHHQQPPVAPPQQQQVTQNPNMHSKPVPMSSGKIYPPDQPMVFNPQNPNAPPIYPCGICHKEVHDNDQAILCESGCNFWFHRICTGLTEAAFHLLTAEVYAEWVCDKCLASKNIPLVKFKP